MTGVLMTETDARTVEDRLAALEAAVSPPAIVAFPEDWTDEQTARFRQEWDSAVDRHDIKWLPPGPKLALTPEFVSQLLRECVTVVKPGETLVIRVQDWTPAQVEQYQEWMNYVGAERGVKVLVVVGEELGVAESEEGATA